MAMANRTITMNTIEHKHCNGNGQYNRTTNITMANTMEPQTLQWPIQWNHKHYNGQYNRTTNITMANTIEPQTLQ